MFKINSTGVLRGAVACVCKISSKPLMVGYLGFLLILGAWWTNQPQLIWRGALIVAIYSVCDLALGYVREGKWIMPISAWISGLIVALVLSPTAPLSIVALAAIFASASKNFLRIRRKHILNPAAFALIALSYLEPYSAAISWWGVTWGRLAFVIILCAGAVTVIKVRRLASAAWFISVYTLGTIMILLARKGAFDDLPTLLLDGTLIFFVTVMLIEPVTTAYQPRWLRNPFGAGVAVLVLWLSAFNAQIRVPDVFMVSLLLGNLGAQVLSHYLRSK